MPPTSAAGRLRRGTPGLNAITRPSTASATAQALTHSASCVRSLTDVTVPTPSTISRAPNMRANTACGLRRRVAAEQHAQHDAGYEQHGQTHDDAAARDGEHIGAVIHRGMLVETDVDGGLGAGSSQLDHPLTRGSAHLVAAQTHA